MPNIKSAKKRMRSNAKKADINKLVYGSMKTAVKKFEKDNTNDNLNIALQRIDKAKNSGLVHKNKAARLKSRLTKAVNKMEEKEA